MKKVGVAGVGAIGGAVCKALLNGITGYELIGVSETKPLDFDLPCLSFSELSEQADLIIECLPSAEVPTLATEALKRGKELLMISSAALLLYPEIKTCAEKNSGRILIPSGALIGIDGVVALAHLGITDAQIISTKPPQGFTGAPFVVEQQIDLNAITHKTKLFEGFRHF